MFYKQREEFEVSAAKRDQELEFPEAVIETKDIRCSEDDCNAHRLDMFRPAGREQEVLPVIVNIHVGGCLLTYFAAIQKNPELAAAAHVTPSDLPLRALGLISGMFYTNCFDKIGLFLPKYLYGKNYKKESFAPYVNPEHPGVAGSLPPCYLVTSKNDHLQRYTLNFTKALAKYHTPYRLQNFPKNPQLTHAFSVFSPFLKESDQSMAAMVEFFRKY